ncbi:hypothetical protein ACF0H5_014416 [Mactra antiquata]
MAASMGSKDDFQSVDRPVLEPLLLPDRMDLYDERQRSPRRSVPCMLCDNVFDTVETLNDYLKHLLEEHRFVIADVKLVANFRGYCMYWKERFKQQHVKEFCSEVQTTSTEDGNGYFMLSDILPEDKQLRELLQRRKLEYILETQQKEREDETFCRSCLFCKEQFHGNRSDLFTHMIEDHGFNVGQPDNLVFTSEFLDILEDKLNSLQCLYCEKIFRDKIVLKEHMRKKQHRKINSKNNIYDRFYVVNYLELGKNWENIQKERDIIEPDTEDTESEDEWSGWVEDIEGQAVCLYCKYSSSNADKLRQHMIELHDFDLQEIKRTLNLSYYQQVKLVNYIRRQGHLGICIGCDNKFDSQTVLLDHMHEENHTNKLPHITVWDQPQYYFPTYENDNLLCQLEDEDDGCHGNENVIAEDNPVLDTILSEETIRKEILTS